MSRLWMLLHTVALIKAPYATWESPPPRLKHVNVRIIKQSKRFSTREHESTGAFRQEW